MTNEPTEPTEAVPGVDAAGDDVPVEPEIHDRPPEHLDLPIEVPEADALEHELEVPLDDDDER